jgi:16S rRNA (cytosine1402-N4)-methyltransferase
MYKHIPVLLQEVLRLVKPQPDKNYIDATLGGGGYTKAILEKNAPAGRVLAFDLDPAALEHARQNLAEYSSRLTLVHDTFARIGEVALTRKFQSPMGIVADIGLSSYQLEASGRGFSFNADEPLDMRFNPDSQQSNAAFIIRTATQGELKRIFQAFGEERLAVRIAKYIVANRDQKAIETTGDLVAVLGAAIPKALYGDRYSIFRRVFQALRIAVNHELSALESFLPASFDLLAPGGVLAIVTFHSLEDRLVKRFFVSLAKGCVCPPDFPQCVCGRTPQAKLLTPKLVTPDILEAEANSRAHSAKLRAVEKL